MIRKSLRLDYFSEQKRLIHTLTVLGRPRTWFFSYFAFLAGVGLGPVTLSTETTLLGLGIFAVWTAATNQLNAYTDRDEDQVNIPERVSMVDDVGPKTLRNVAFAEFLLSVIAAAWIDLAFGALMILAAFVGFFYSMPPFRFKARPLGSLASFSGAFGLPLAGGVVLSSPELSIPPIVWLMTYWFFTYGAVKNLPDYHGDKEAGLRTPATIFDTQRDAVIFAGILLFSPFPLIAGAVAVGVIQPVYLALLAFAPVVIYFTYRSLESDTSSELEVAHTVGFLYAMAMAAVFFLLQNPSIDAVPLAAIPFVVIVTIQVTGFDSR